MACRDAYEMTNNYVTTDMEGQTASETGNAAVIDRLLFGVDSAVPANGVLQNNLTVFEWATRNKLYPTFWGRNITGENCLTKAEIGFLHEKGCAIAAVYTAPGAKETEKQGQITAKKAAVAALELGIPKGTAVFLEIEESENAARDYMKGYAQGLLEDGYAPGFRANTDAAYDFDREYSRGMQTDRECFERCLVWAVAPGLQEYDRITTTHLIHPDFWTPYAPSGITRKEIAVWQYGKECHPICDDAGKEISFNIDLVRNERVITAGMF